MMRAKTTGGNVIRACALLPAVTGNLCNLNGAFDAAPTDSPAPSKSRFALACFA